jgi:aerobic-type carbon monoxide dehydrogenase small subunit (CoxS/CutS family)
MARVTELHLNGAVRRIDADADRSLLSVLRNDLDLTGTKYGCGEGQCGACMVLVDGRATNACITPISSVASQKITTIEGLEQNGRVHPLQQAFLDDDALQCGYCTSGMIVSGVALLQHAPKPSREEIVEGMNRNLCRCCVYPRIIAAVQRASGQSQKNA